MILYIFNNPFPDNSGFGKRCKKEIKILSEKEEVIVICKKLQKDPKYEVIELHNNKISIYRFTTFLNNNVMSFAKQVRIIQEIVTNIDLLIGFIITLLHILFKNRKKVVTIYVVVSPLTVPLFSYMFTFFFKIKQYIVEYHDLEPELAMHIKNLHKNSLITKIEFLLEKIVCRMYHKIIVTTNTQKDYLVKRTGILGNKVLVIPNSIQVANTKQIVTKKNDNKFVIGYVSSLTYFYSISDILSLFQFIYKNKKLLTNEIFVIVGDGSLLPFLRNKVEQFNLHDRVQFTGKVADTFKIIHMFDICIIPWKKDTMTQTMAPTKLFEYMQAKKAIIAPNYGEFNKILSHNDDALLYNSIKELFLFINTFKLNKNLVDKLATNARISFQHQYRSEIYGQKLLDFVEV